MGKTFNFTERELKVLTNFSSINNQVLIKNDSFLVKNASTSMVGIYRFENPYSQFNEMGIYDTPEFLSILNSLENSKIDFNETYVNILDENRKYKIKYGLMDKSLFPNIPIEKAEEKIKEMNLFFDFELKEEYLSMLKIGSLLKNNYISIKNSGKSILITTTNDENINENNFTIEVKEKIKQNTENEVIIPIEHFLKILKEDYDILVYDRLAKLKSKTDDLVYYIGVIKNN